MTAVLATAALLSLRLDDARGEPRAPAPAQAALRELPELPGPSPRPRRTSPLSRAMPDIRKVNEECASCHVDIAEEWRSSLHRQAWVDPLFQSAYAIEPVAFCRGCHAPEAPASAEPGEAAKAVGVGCTTCHVQAGERVVGPREAPGAPHGVFADARLSTASACASCHQFDFPGERSPMQDTVREHAASSFAKSACQECHMPVVMSGGPPGAEARHAAAPAPAPARSPGARPHKSHAFLVLGDPAMIRRAVTITAKRPSARRVEITLAPAMAGHAFPTGDMFRRLEVRAAAVDAEGRAIADAERVYLGRTFIDRPRDGGASLSFHRTQAADTRVPPPGGDPRVVVVSFGRPVGAARVRWRVVYQRMATAMAASFGIDQTIDEVLVGEGELPPEGSKAR